MPSRSALLLRVLCLTSVNDCCRPVAQHQAPLLLGKAEQRAPCIPKDQRKMNGNHQQATFCVRQQKSRACAEFIVSVRKRRRTVNTAQPSDFSAERRNFGARRAVIELAGTWCL